MTTSKYTANFLVALTALIWGTSFVVIRFGLNYFDPISFVFLRFLFSVFLFLPVIIIKKINVKKVLFDKKIISIGFFNFVAFFFQYLGQDLTTAGNSALFVNFYVVIVPIFSHFFLNEKIGVKTYISAVIGFIGVFFVITNLNFKELMSGTFLGNILTFGASLGWTGYIIISKKSLNETNSELETFFGSIFWTTIFLLPEFLYFLVLKKNTVLDFSLISILCLLYLVVFCTVGAFSLYLFALKFANVSQSSIFLLLEIVVAFSLEIILSIFYPGLFPHSIPGTWSFFGIFLIILSMFLVSIKFTRKNRPLVD